MDSESFPKMTHPQNEVLAKYSSDIVKRGLLLAQEIEALASAPDLPTSMAETGKIESLLLQGLTLYKKGNPEKAVEFFNEILEINSSYIDALCFRGFALDSLGSTGEAVKDFAGTLNLNPTDECTYVLYAQGVAYSLTGQSTDAKQKFLKVLQAKIKQSSIFTAWELYFRACAQYLFFSNKQFALHNCEQVFLIDPDHLLNLVLHGSVLNELGNHERAIEILTKAIIAHPLHIKADITFYSRGLAYYQLNDFDAAIGDFSCSLVLNPKNARSYLYRALAYVAVGNFIQAEEDANRALEVDPELYNTDLKVLDASFAYEPETRQAMSNLFVYTGDIHDELENYQYAIEDYSYAIALDSNNTEADMSRNLALLELDEYEDPEMVSSSLKSKIRQSSFLSFLYSMAQFLRTIDRISALKPETAAELHESFLKGFNACSG